MNTTKKHTQRIILLFALMTLVIFLPSVNADTEQEFLDSVNITVTVTQETTQIDFDLNTTGKSFDIQDITFNNVTVNDVSIQEILNGAHWELELVDGSAPRFKCVCITTGSVTAILLDALLDDMNAGFDVADINEDEAVLNEYLEENAPLWDGPDSTFKKTGTHYTITIDRGYTDDSIEDIVKDGVARTNVGVILEDLFSMVAPGALNDSLSDIGLDFAEDINYTITCMDMDEVMLEDGTYNVPVFIHCNNNGQTYREDITLILSGIRNNDLMCPVNGTYFPTNEGIQAYIVKISGLGVNTINVTLFDTPAPSGAILPSDTNKVVKYMQISVANQTSAVIEFKVRTSKVSDPALVDFYVLEGSSWVILSTDFAGTSGGFHRYSADIPHFSNFMIMEKNPSPQPTPQQTTSTSSTGGSSGGSSGNSGNTNSVAPVVSDQGDSESTDLEPIASTPPESEPESPSPGITGAIVDKLGGGSLLVAILIMSAVAIAVAFGMRERLQ